MKSTVDNFCKIFAAEMWIWSHQVIEIKSSIPKGSLSLENFSHFLNVMLGQQLLKAWNQNPKYKNMQGSGVTCQVELELHFKLNWQRELNSYCEPA